MAKRLVKVASELNVGTGTIVEHLKSNGFTVEDKPTAKITDEMYQNLLEEFRGSIAIKEQADLLTIGTRKTKEKEAEVMAAPLAPQEPETLVVEVEDEPTSLPEEVEIEVPQEIKVAEKAPPVEAPTPEPVQEEVKVEVVEVEEEIEMPSFTEEVEEEAPKAKETPKAKKEPEAKKEAPKEKAKKKTKEPAKEETPHKLEGLKVVDKVDLKELKNKNKRRKKKPADRQEKPAAQKNTTPKAKQQSKQEHKQKQKETPKAEPKAPTPKVEEVQISKAAAEYVEPEMYRAETPTLKGVKVLGKIDPSKLKKQPSKKRKDNRKDNKNQGQNKQGQNKNNNQSADGKKRRRKRKKVATGEQKPNTSGNNRGSGGNRSGDNRGGGNRGGNNRGGNRRGGNNRSANREISKKEVDEKLKETMARMQGGGKNRRQKIRREERSRRREKQELIELENQGAAQIIQLTEFIPVAELASLMNVSATEVITACMNMGVIVAINQRLDAEIIELVAEEFGHNIEFISAEAQMEIEEDEVIDAPEDLSPRAPIVTVMGHVDHGKTSLLDYIRSAKVMEGEAGGITQHIGAYEVKVGEEDRRITFLDTPGHEAFTAMRARGAKVTDVAVIIVAADDNVMPQTKEAISHAQAAGVPIIFAINKIDKDGANPERIKQELSSMNLLVEDWGGKFPSQEISAKFGDGVDELLEKILLESDILELKANSEREAQGVVLEASLDKGRGYVSKFLIQAGTLKIGDSIVAGSHYGKVRAMINERGQRVQTAGPSAPVLILGMKGAPQAGEKFKVMKAESDARQLAAKRAQIQSEQERRATKRLSLEEIGRRLALGSFKELNLIVKGDVDGSIEALSDSLLKLSTETVQVNIVHKAVGQIIESDILLASASDAIIVGFQVRPSAIARKLAEKEGVQIKTYSVIYAAIEEIKSAIEGMLEPTKEEKITATVEVREVFKISKVGTIAGCYVQEGTITRNSMVRVIRDGIVIYPIKEGVVGELASLKRYKDDVKEVRNNTECGMNIKNFNDIKVGDIIEGYEIIEIKQKLK